MDPPSPLFKGGGVNFKYLPQSLKNFKRGWKYGAGGGLLKKGETQFTSFLKVSKSLKIWKSELEMTNVAGTSYH